MPSSSTAPREFAQPDLEALVHEGLSASQAGDSVRAIELFNQAGAQSPGSAVPHFLAGSEYASVGDIEKAELALANAVLLAPGFHVARYQLGLLQFSSGRAAPALVTWSPLLDLPPETPLPHFVRGFAALAQDDFALARLHFEHGLGCKQDNPAIASDIEQVLARIANAAPAQAATPPTEDSPVEAASHVLVSNYGRFGTLH